MALSTTTLKTFGTWTVHEHVFQFLTKWHNHVHAWKTSSSKGSLLREQSEMCGLWSERVFRVRIAACRAGRPRSGSHAQRNPPPTSRYCPHQRQKQQQHPGRTGVGKGGTRGGREDRKEGWNWPLPFGEGVEAEVQTRGQEGEGKRKEKMGEEEEEEAPVLSGAVCVCLYVCSHTVEINLPSGLSLWNKERRKLARSDTLREKWRETRQAQGGMVAFRSNVDGDSGNLLLTPPTKLQAHLPKSWKTGASIPSSTPLNRNQDHSPNQSFTVYVCFYDTKRWHKKGAAVDEEITQWSP